MQAIFRMSEVTRETTTDIARRVFACFSLPSTYALRGLPQAALT